MIPILSETGTLEGMGLGLLSDALECIVTHEVNGEYELRMRYPVTGQHYSEILEGRIVFAKPDNTTADQAFRIYRITRPLNNIVTIYARHIAYDMSGIVTNPLSAGSMIEAMTTIMANSVPECPFTLTTSRTVASPFVMKEPKALWRVLGGSEGSLLDVYGGEWDFNNFTATLTSRLGQDRGVSVRYGKNMTELEQDITIEATYKYVYPYWYDEDTNTLIRLPEVYVEVAGGFGDRALLMDFSGDFEDAPTVSQLRERTEQYINANKVGEPKISWKVSFVQLGQSEEYKDLALMDQVQLGDTVKIYYEPMEIEATSRAVKIEYNTLIERYETVTLGRVKQNLAKIVAATGEEINKAVSAAKSALERAVDSATDFITNGAGYMRFIYNSNDELVEIVSLDDPDITQAQSVWRWNNGGFGHSSNGYAGPYTAAITQDGAIVADFITTGTLNAARVYAGILRDQAGKNYWNLETGEFVIREGSINISTDEETNDIIKMEHNEFIHELQPLQWVLENSTIHAKLQAQAGGLYGYRGPANGTTLTRATLLTSDGHLYLGGTGAGGEFSGALYVENGTNHLAYTAGLNNGMLSMKRNTNYTFLVWPDANGAGRLVLGDGVSTRWATSITKDGMQFRNGADAVETEYMNGSFDVHNGTNHLKFSSTTPSLQFLKNTNYTACIFADSNGAGQLVLGDGVSTRWMTELTNSGLRWRNGQDAITTSYMDGSFDVHNGTNHFKYSASTSILQMLKNTNYTFLLWPDSDGAGRLVLGDGISTRWRTELTNGGLVFRNGADVKTASYMADGTVTGQIVLDNGFAVGSKGYYYNTNDTRTYELTAGHMYLLVYCRTNSTSSTRSGLWIVNVRSDNSSVAPVLVPSSTPPTVSISGTTLTVVNAGTYDNVRIIDIGGTS